LSDDRLLLFHEEGPTRETRDKQYARGDGKESPGMAVLVSRLELRKIAVAGAAGSQVIEPLFRFG